MADPGKQIIEKAIELGATLAGVADIALLKGSPSSEFLRKIGAKADGVYWTAGERELTAVQWPEKAEAALVIAVSHPESAPELDYWAEIKGGTAGNRHLMDINREVSSWIETAFGIKTHRMPYGVDAGGIYLKDAAVLAGLGCLGRNNILVTPDYGSRVRLRGLLLDAKATPTGPIDFHPCDDCEEYCRQACPQNAFGEKVHHGNLLGFDHLPGLDGSFSRARCKIQMDKDVAAANDSPGEGVSSSGRLGSGEPSKPYVDYCRRCEFACPVGR